MLLQLTIKAACVVVGSRNCERHCAVVLAKRPKRQGINGEGESGRRPKGKVSCGPVYCRWRRQPKELTRPDER